MVTRTGHKVHLPSVIVDARLNVHHQDGLDAKAARTGKGHVVEYPVVHIQMDRKGTIPENPERVPSPDAFSGL